MEEELMGIFSRLNGRGRLIMQKILNLYLSDDKEAIESLHSRTEPGMRDGTLSLDEFEKILNQIVGAA